MASQTHQPVFRADRKSRFRGVLLLVLLIVVGALTIWGTQQRLDQILELAEQDPQAAVAAATTLCAVFALVVVVGNTVVGGWIIRRALAIRAAGQFPPPGSRPMRHTPVRTGAAAQSIANVHVFLGILIIVLGLAAGWILYRLPAVLFSQG